MSVISRILGKVCRRQHVLAGSADEKRIAALLIWEFQYGENSEADLTKAFTSGGSFKLTIPFEKLNQIFGDASRRGEDDLIVSSALLAITTNSGVAL